MLVVYYTAVPPTVHKRLRAIVYGRQSHGKQKSIAEQVDLCTADAIAQGWDVVLTLRDRTSASRYRQHDREEWARVVDAIRAGEGDVLVVWASSRADRDPVTWFPLLEACRVAGVRIRITDDQRTYDVTKSADWQSLAHQGIANAVESDQKSTAIRRGQLGSAQAGRPAHGRTPWGYRRLYDLRTGDLVGQEPDPELVELIQEIFRRAAAHEPLAQICRDLDERDVPRPARGGWYVQRIRDICTNPVYAGRRVYNGQTFPGSWPAIIDADLWDRVQRVLRDPARTTNTRPGAQVHLLSFIARCWRCQGPARVLRAAYVGAGCSHFRISEALTDELVLEIVVERLSQPDIYRALRHAGEDADRATAAAWRDVDQLTAELEGWRLAAIESRISPDSFATIEGGLRARIGHARARADQYIPQPLRELVEPGVDVRARVRLMPIAAVRTVITRLIDPLVIGPARAKGTRFDPTRLDLSRWRGDARTWRELRHEEVN